MASQFAVTAKPHRKDWCSAALLLLQNFPAKVLFSAVRMPKNNITVAPVHPVCLHLNILSSGWLSGKVLCQWQCWNIKKSGQRQVGVYDSQVFGNASGKHQNFIRNFFRKPNASEHQSIRPRLATPQTRISFKKIGTGDLVKSSISHHFKIFRKHPCLQKREINVGKRKPSKSMYIVVRSWYY